MKKTVWIIISIILILGVWIGLAFIAINQNWVENAGIFGDMFGAANALFSGIALIGIVYAIYLQQEEMRLFRKEKEMKEKRRMKQIEPELEFGSKRHERGNETHHLMEVTVSDKDDKLRNPRVIPLWGKFDGLNIGKKGQKCKDHQHRIAATVPNEKNGQFQLLYEDVDGNHYSKFISWYPLEVSNKL